MRGVRGLVIALAVAATPAMAQQSGVTAPDPILKNALAHPRPAVPPPGPEKDVKVVCVAASCHDLQMKIGDMARNAGWNVFYVVKGPVADDLALEACQDHLSTLYSAMQNVMTTSVNIHVINDGACNPRSEAVITLGP